MSHFATYACPVNNEAYLTKALEEMGLGLRKDQVIDTGYGDRRRVELAVVRNGKLLPIGFNKKESGEYELIADWFRMPWGEKAFTGTVAQLHDKYRVLDICEQNRWNVREEDITVNENGEIEILATQWA
ncbi:DUF1257 domain-containing protein [Alicyclobacillus shizuokensis]|uniref:DUF1257 domain-containing protein n=1 Tax=Alicyclobacillus shizuokensis TaxID=392014 RepID=UPI000833CD82|nr:DUF1257 domain-containing protein [Alicyclobacillus shizuokensis]